MTVISDPRRNRSVRAAPVFEATVKLTVISDAATTPGADRETRIGTAVHEHPAPTITLTLPTPPAPPTLSDADDARRYSARNRSPPGVGEEGARNGRYRESRYSTSPELGRHPAS
jgi:hypothetical protein